MLDATTENKVHEALSAFCLRFCDTVLIGPDHPGTISDWEYLHPNYRTESETNNL